MWIAFFHRPPIVSSVCLYVPVDRRLERMGVQGIASRRFQRRPQGAKILAHFRSAANIRRLRGLLGDPGRWTETTGRPGVPRIRVYAVRQAVWKAP